jgi:hypothetical protein
MMIGQFRAKGDWGFWGLVWGNFFFGITLGQIFYIPPKPNILFFMIGNIPQSQIPIYILQIVFPKDNFWTQGNPRYPPKPNILFFMIGNTPQSQIFYFL